MPEASWETKAIIAGKLAAAGNAVEAALDTVATVDRIPYVAALDAGVAWLDEAEACRKQASAAEWGSVDELIAMRASDNAARIAQGWLAVALLRQKEGLNR